MPDSQPLGGGPPFALDGGDDLETSPTSQADLESASRSCMVIVLLLGAIVFLLGLWIAFHATGAGQ